MISNEIKNIIKIYWGKYNIYIANIPPIEEIYSEQKEDSWAHFSVEDLYNRRYIFYVNEKLKNYPNELIEQVLFHEFTHLSDSIQFLSYDFNDFKALMSIYSETHAATIMMDRLLMTQKQKPYTLEQNVVYNVKLTLQSFMNQTQTRLINEFTFSDPKCKLFYNRKYFYYFVGYLISLKEHDILYEYNFDCLDIEFKNLFIDIIDFFLNKKHNIKMMIEYENLLYALSVSKLKEKLLPKREDYNTFSNKKYDSTAIYKIPKNKKQKKTLFKIFKKNN